MKVKTTDNQEVSMRVDGRIEGIKIQSIELTKLDLDNLAQLSPTQIKGWITKMQPKFRQIKF